MFSRLFHELLNRVTARAPLGSWLDRGCVPEQSEPMEMEVVVYAKKYSHTRGVLYDS